MFVVCISFSFFSSLILFVSSFFYLPYLFLFTLPRLILLISHTYSLCVSLCLSAFCLSSLYPEFLPEKNGSLIITHKCVYVVNLPHGILFAEIDKCLLNKPRKLEKGHRTSSFGDSSLLLVLLLNKS